MDSPQREPNPPPSSLQESPFFKYLCSLSPIKTTKFVHVPQTYSEMTFPPPPTVFVSPPVSSHKGLSLRSSCMLTNDHKDLVSEMAVSAEITIERGILEDSWVNRNKSCPSGSTQEVDYEFCFVADYCDQHMKTGSTNLGDEESCAASKGCSIHYETKHIEQYSSEPSAGDLYGTDLEVNEGQLHENNFNQKFKTLLGHPVKGSIVRSLTVECKKVCGGCVESVDDDMRQNASGKSNVATSAEDETVMMDDLNSLSQIQLENKVQKHKSVLVSEVSEESLPRNDNFHVLEGLVLHDLVNFAQDQSASTVSIANPNGVTAHYQENGTESMTSCPNDQQTVDNLESTATQQDEHEGAQCIKKEISFHALHFREGRFSSQLGTSIRASGIGPRGFRRRCLDFEISEGRRKSLGGKVPLSIHDVANAAEQTSFVSPNISTMSLCERAAATSDATNSEASNADNLMNHFSFGDYQSDEEMVANMVHNIPKCTNDGTLVATKNRVAGKNLQDLGSSRGSVNIPSGIGLHLNSLHTNVRTLMISNSNSPIPGCLYAPAATEVHSGTYEGSVYSAGHQEANISAGSFASSGPRLVVSLVEKTNINQRATMASGSSHLGVLNSSACFQSLLVEQPQDEDVGVERKTSSFEKMLQQDLSQQDFSDVAENVSQSPHSPKKRSSGSKDKASEGCKHCKCKKSRCLKLYCECFAAGVYCVDSCTCHECFNKPEYEETVLGTRHQIESRNPLAFAPKILRAAESSPADGGAEDLTSTPASGRHKRGCNCKKSLCLKKYCECYQAGVGCSEGCRCEGCKNVYGRKEGAEENKEKELHFDSGDKDPSLGKPEAIRLENAVPKPDQRSINKDISPITPSFELGWQGKSTAKSRHGKKRTSDQAGSPLYLPSAPNSGKPSKLSTPPCNFRKSSRSDIPQATSNMKVAGSPSSKIITPNMNELSPRWDGLDDICTLTPLPQHPSRPLPTSTSNLDKTVATLSLNGQDKEQPLRSLALRIASTDGTCSLALQTASNSSSMPITPLLPSTLFSTTNRSTHEQEGVDEDCPVAFGEDHVPTNIDETSRPFKTRTTRSSPKQKRVTPPHCEVTKNRIAGSPARKSPGLRKFILQALPPDKQQSQTRGLVSTGPDEA